MQELDYKKIKENIVNIIKKYNFYILSVANNMEIYVNDDFSFDEIILKNDNSFNASNSLNNELKEKRIKFINYFRFSFNKLTTDERKLIYWSYLDKEDNYDDRYIANTLGFSLGYYYIKKKETLIRFAYALGTEVTWFNLKTCMKGYDFMFNNDKIIITSIKNVEEMYKDKESQMPEELKQKMEDVIYKGYEVLSNIIEEDNHVETKENEK